MAIRWPETLWLVRHGQSAGNVARDAAHEAGLERIALTGRDVDVPLSPLGEQQAQALGRWFMDGPSRPEVLLSSPYVRAQQTAQMFRDAGGCAPDLPVCLDERLREKEFGILDGLTTPGVATVFPDQAEFRRILGKFYHRPPGGESWADVILRLRSLLDTVSLHHAGERVMIVAHQVVVLCLRYVIEGMDEQRILAIDKENEVANCSVTEYRLDAKQGPFGKLELARYNETAPMEEAGTPVTSAPEPIRAVRGVIRLDRDWLRDHPLPAQDHDTDKNKRGRLVVVGGSRFVPGAVRLTAEAALRAGAGKLQLATVADTALALGVAMPEVAVIGLDADANGEIDGAAAASALGDTVKDCDALVLGPGMSGSKTCAGLVAAMLERLEDHAGVVLDAAAIGACRDCGDSVRAVGGRAVLTPHAGEMAALSGRDYDWIGENPETIACATARDLNAVVVLKGARTVIAFADAEPLEYAGGGPGLATGGSGDVLAGVLGGLLAQSVDPLQAAAWAVWVHGEAGAMLTARFGGPGLLARELPELLPALLHSRATR